MNKEEIYNYLKENNIKYEIDEHKAVYNMEELKDIVLKYPESDAKNIFVRDDKKRNYYLITTKGDKKVDLKDFKNKYNKPVKAINYIILPSLISILLSAIAAIELSCVIITTVLPEL